MGFGGGVVEGFIVLRVGLQGDGLTFAAFAQPVPEFLGEEGHDGVQKLERGFKDLRDVTPVARDLFELDVPVAEIVVDEVPDGLGGFVITIAVDGAVHVARGLVEPGIDPLVF